MTEPLNNYFIYQAIVVTVAIGLSAGWMWLCSGDLRRRK